MASRKYRNPKITINKVYTRRGDKAETSLVGGQIVAKNDPRVEAYGNIDELNASIGVCIEELKELSAQNSFLIDLITILNRIQHELFNLGTILATVSEDVTKDMPQITFEDISSLEEEIDDANSKLAVLHSFILPGGNKINAYLHLSRTICRRCERSCCILFEKKEINEMVIAYLNRLSDALFVWSRWVIHVLEMDENLWDPNKSSSSQSS